MKVILYCLNWHSTRYHISVKLEIKEIGKKKGNTSFFSFWVFFLPLGRIVNSTVILYRCSSANNHVFAYILLLDFILEKQHPSFLLHVPLLLIQNISLLTLLVIKSVWGFSPHQGKFSATPAGCPSAVLILPIWIWCRIP